MSLRIRTPGSEGGGRRDGEDLPAASPDYYMSRLVKLIPSEAIVAYPFLNSRAMDVAEQVRAPVAAGAPPVAASGLDAVPAGAGEAVMGVSPGSLASDPIVIAVAWLILLVVILLRWQATRDGNGPAQWGAVFIAAVSFVLWVPVMGGSFGLLDTAQAYSGIALHPDVQKFIPELLLVLWSVLIPAFYRPEN